MSPRFALDLSLDGIRLLFRAEGGWTVVGDVALEDPALSDRLAALRRAAADIAPDGLATELVIPPSQIRYAAIPRPVPGPVSAEDILPALTGLTLLPPEELVFDWVDEGDTLRLALVDTLTLSEAETFAAAHRFNPVSFGARPTPAQFPRPVDFGPTARAARDAARPAAPAPTPAAPEAAPDGAVGFSSVRAAAGSPPAPAPSELRGNLTPAALALRDTPAEAEETAPAPEAAPELSAPDLRVPVAVSPEPAAPAEFAPAPADPAALPLSPDALASTLTAPLPAEPAPRPAVPEAPFAEVTPSADEPAPAEPGAAVLARSLAAPRPAHRPAPPPPARSPFAPRRLALAGGAAAAVAALALGFALTRDPAASLPDTPPDVAMALPALAAPDAAPPGTSPLAPAASPDASPETAAAPESDAPPVAAPESAPDRVADTAAPILLADDAPAVLPAPTLPTLPAADAGDTTDAIYVASIDRATPTRDAIALLPAALFSSSPRPASPLPPPPAGTAFDRGADGLVVATPEGALTPDGIVVRLGPPPLTPPQAPGRAAAPAAPAAEAADLVAFADPALADARPRSRPAGLVERFERATLGGRTRAELAALRPLARPLSEQAQALAAAPDAPPSEYAVAVSLVPEDRPADFAARIATAQAVAAALAAPVPEPEPAPAPEPAPVEVAAAPPPAPAAPAPAPAPAPEPQRETASSADDYDDGEPETAAAAPNIPTSASVAQRATIRNAMDLREINLIGVYGTERDRRALVRLPSGRMVKVEVGDRLDGGRIAAIGRDELRYTKGGRSITLEVPSG